MYETKLEAKHEQGDFPLSSRSFNGFNCAASCVCVHRFSQRVCIVHRMSYSQARIMEKIAPLEALSKRTRVQQRDLDRLYTQLEKLQQSQGEIGNLITGFIFDEIMMMSND